MNQSIKLLVFLFGIVFFLVFIFSSRNKSLKPFYSALWLLISIYMLSFAIFEKTIKSIATFLGFSDASFLVIVSLISFLMLYVFHLSIKISTMSDRIQELISFTSILENEIRNMYKRMAK